MRAKFVNEDISYSVLSGKDTEGNIKEIIKLIKEFSGIKNFNIKKLNTLEGLTYQLRNPKNNFLYQISLSNIGKIVLKFKDVRNENQIHEIEKHIDTLDKAKRAIKKYFEDLKEKGM